MTAFLRLLFHLLIVRPVVHGLLGLDVRHREHLPETGPAILVANHDSHLDALVLMSMYPLGRLARLAPIAAGAYFARTRLAAFLSTRLLRTVLLRRGARRGGEEVLAGCDAALARGEVLILFPEGTRGEPGRAAPFRSGVAHLARRRPDVPVVPVFLAGPGRAMPRGATLIVPFPCTAVVGRPLRWTGDRATFMQALEDAMDALAREAGTSWRCAARPGRLVAR